VIVLLFFQMTGVSASETPCLSSFSPSLRRAGARLPPHSAEFSQPLPFLPFACSSGGWRAFFPPALFFLHMRGANHAAALPWDGESAQPISPLALPHLPHTVISFFFSLGAPTPFSSRREEASTLLLSCVREFELLFPFSPSRRSEDEARAHRLLFFFLEP